MADWTEEEIRERITKRMNAIDRLTPQQRAVVHDYGWAVVKTLRDCGVSEPKLQIMVINKVLYELSSVYRDMANTGRKLPKPAALTSTD